MSAACTTTASSSALKPPPCGADGQLADAGELGELGPQLVGDRDGVGVRVEGEREAGAAGPAGADERVELPVADRHLVRLRRRRAPASTASTFLAAASVVGQAGAGGQLLGDVQRVLAGVVEEVRLEPGGQRRTCRTAPGCRSPRWSSGAGWRTGSPAGTRAAAGCAVPSPRRPGAPPRLGAAGGGRRNQYASTGTTVSDTSSEASRATVTVIANGANSCPTNPPTRAIGANTATVVRVDAVTAPATSRTPVRMACSFSSPYPDVV